jgi:hypothetical protein
LSHGHKLRNSSFNCCFMHEQRKFSLQYSTRKNFCSSFECFCNFEEPTFREGKPSGSFFIVELTWPTNFFKFVLKNVSLKWRRGWTTSLYGFPLIGSTPTPPAPRLSIPSPGKKLVCKKNHGTRAWSLIRNEKTKCSL